MRRAGRNWRFRAAYRKVREVLARLTAGCLCKSIAHGSRPPRRCDSAACPAPKQSVMAARCWVRHSRVAPGNNSSPLDMAKRAAAGPIFKARAQMRAGLCYVSPTIWTLSDMQVTGSNADFLLQNSSLRSYDEAGQPGRSWLQRAGTQVRLSTVAVLSGRDCAVIWRPVGQGSPIIHSARDAQT